MIAYLAYIKALHIIFIVSWFSGVFFLGRILVYHREALEKPENEKEVLIPLLTSAARRVWYIIIIPSMIITLGMGGTLMVQLGAYREGWFHFKLLFILAFLIYHVYYAKYRKQLKQGHVILTSLKFRLFKSIFK